MKNRVSLSLCGSGCIVRVGTRYQLVPEDVTLGRVLILCLG
jgi:hypothetical protein